MFEVQLLLGLILEDAYAKDRCLVEAIAHMYPEEVNSYVNVFQCINTYIILYNIYDRVNFCECSELLLAPP